MPYDAVDAPNIFKSLHFEFGYFLSQVLNTPLIPLCNLAHFLYGVVNLHGAGRHFVHAVGDDAGEAIELLHFGGNTLSALQHFFRACLDFYRYRIDTLDGGEHFLAAVFLLAHCFGQPGAHFLDLFGKGEDRIELFLNGF